MGARQKDWARRTRERLLDELGRVCRWCGLGEGDTDEHGREVKLTFDCIVPLLTGRRPGDGQHEHHRRFEWSQRMSFYRGQCAAGNLQVLCDRCNSRKSDSVSFHEAELEPVNDNEPF